MGKTIDYVAAIKNIVEGNEMTPTPGVDLKELKKMLDFLKTQVLYELVQNVVAEDPKLQEQIDAAKAILEQRRDALQQWQKEGEHSAKHIDAEKIESMISTLDDLAKQTGAPKEFVRTLITEYTKSPLDMLTLEAAERAPDTLNLLLQQCASGLRDVHTGEMESARVGESSDPTAGYAIKESMRPLLRRFIVEAGEYDRNYGVNLFRKTADNKYIPNEENIRNFLELIRNPELLSELENHSLHCSFLEAAQAKLEKIQVEFAEQKKIKEALSNEGICTQLEEYFSGIIVARRDKEKADRELSGMSSSLTVKRGLFQNIWYQLSGQKAKDEAEHKTAVEKYGEKCDELKAIERKHEDSMTDNPLYSKLYSTYIETAASFDQRGYATQEVLEEFLVQQSKKHKVPIHQLLAQRIDVDTRLAKIQENIKDASGEIETQQRSAQSAFEALSPRAKELVVATERGYVRTEGLKSKYVTHTAPAHRNVSVASPYVSALILEAVMDRDNIHTEEQLLQYGISFTDEDIQKSEDAKKTMLRDLKRKLDKISRIGQKEVEDISR